MLSKIILTILLALLLLYSFPCASMMGLISPNLYDYSEPEPEPDRSFCDNFYLFAGPLGNIVSIIFILSFELLRIDKLGALFGIGPDYMATGWVVFSSFIMAHLIASLTIFLYKKLVAFISTRI
jgi:hypothetical protein